MRLRTIHVSRYAPVVPSLWVDTSGAKPVLKAHVNGRYQTLSEEIPAGILTEDMIVNSLDSDAVDMPLSAAQGKILKSLLDGKQDILTPGTGIEITDDNTINVTLDTTVFKVVPSLPDSPASGDKNKIHLVPSESTGENNSYKEYLWVNNEWEEIGTYVSTVDLTPYLTKEDAGKTYQTITDSSLQTQDKTVVGGINEVSTELKEVVKPYVINLTGLLAAQDSESISTAIGGIDNLNGTVQKNQVIFGTLANGTVAVGIRVLGNQTTLTYFVDSLAGLTVNEVIITNTSGTLTKTVNTHAVLTENMVIDSLDSEETTLPLSAAQGKILNEKIQSSTSGVYYTNMLSGIDFTSSNLTDDDINQYIGSWDELVNAVQTNTPIFDKVNLEGHSGSQYSTIPVVAGMAADNAVDITMFVGVDDSYRQIKILKVADNNYTLLSAKKVILDNDNNAALLTDDKTVTGAINENFNSIKTVNKSIGQPTIEDIDLSTPDENGYYWTYQNVKSANGSYGIKHIPLNKGDLLIVDSYAGNDTNIICITDSTYASPVSDFIMRGADAGRTAAYLADKDCFVALSYHVSLTGTASIVRSTQNTAIADIATSTAALHKIYEEYGAVYNAETGYWELNGLTDLTEEEMYDIYLAGDKLSQANLWCGAYCRNNKIRTNFAPKYGNDSGVIGSKSITGLFYGCSSLEKAVLGNESLPLYIQASSPYAFSHAVKLREIKGIINCTGSTVFTSTFSSCFLLNTVKIDNLQNNISFKDSPLISYESLNYIVTNAANTSSITVTVHPTTYSYLIGTAQPTAEVGGTTEKWQALVASAQAKQISFAVPEETQSETE